MWCDDRVRASEVCLHSVARLPIDALYGVRTYAVGSRAREQVKYMVFCELVQIDFKFTWRLLFVKRSFAIVSLILNDTTHRLLQQIDAAVAIANQLTVYKKLCGKKKHCKLSACVCFSGV